jgi:hypothetical protein
LELLALVAAFITGGFIGQWVARRIRISMGWIALMAIVTSGGSFLLLLGLPFYGAVGECFLVFTAAGALMWPLALTFRLRPREKPRIGPSLAVGLLALPLTAGVLWSLNFRIRYATQLAWECDGLISERTRNSKKVPRIVVETTDRLVTFDAVSEEFWSEVRPGHRVTKASGSPTAILEGKPVRILRRTGFWNDPP